MKLDEDAPKLRIVAPMSDEEKKSIFYCDIQYMTKEEILEMYGDYLTEEQLKQLEL